ncbi:MAG TPA: DDE-type integrase/transposase/recombinase [Solirubrobacteraceae bacterium]|nr:DDE-type integrase/transposase/recombinase [Solirubrobacteraceae bacterium]
MDRLTPKDHGEALAIFRSEVVGALTRRELVRGELEAELRKLSAQRFRPPGADHTRTYSLVTLGRWYYAYRRGGLAALRPQPRSDRGRAHGLTAEQRELLLDIRREHPSASVPLVLRTLCADGRLGKSDVSPQTVRRLYREHGLDRQAERSGAGPRMRLRWQAERPGALWHGDVCHGAAITIDGKARTVRIHGLLDDASRYVVALEAHHTEREVDMLGVLVRALRRHGPPDAIYLDNGSTYRGDHLRTACARLGVSLLHARPYDAPARGKMERFWRTLRQGCLDFTGNLASLHDVNVRLFAFLDEHYHVAPHAALLGRSPKAVYAAGERALDELDEKKLRDALTIRVRRRVRRDSTVPLDGQTYELDQGFLSGRLVMVARCLVDLAEPPWIEHEGKHLPLHLVDPLGNARRKRSVRVDRTTVNTVAFDPPGVLLDRATGRRAPREEKSQ